MEEMAIRSVSLQERKGFLREERCLREHAADRQHRQAAVLDLVGAVALEAVGVLAEACREQRVREEGGEEGGEEERVCANMNYFYGQTHRDIAGMSDGTQGIEVEVAGGAAGPLRLVEDSGAVGQLEQSHRPEQKPTLHGCYIYCGHCDVDLIAEEEVVELRRFKTA